MLQYKYNVYTYIYKWDVFSCNHFSVTHIHRTIPECKSFLPWPRCHGSSSLFGEVISFSQSAFSSLPHKEQLQKRSTPNRGTKVSRLCVHGNSGDQIREPSSTNPISLTDCCCGYELVSWRLQHKCPEGVCLMRGVMFPDVPGMFPEDKEPSNHLKYEVLIVCQWPN